MDPKFQSSFIPKGPINTAGSLSRGPIIKQRNIFGIIGMFIFVVTVILAIGVFGYTKYLESSISKMGDELEQARAALDPSVIKELSLLDARINATKNLLDNHIVLSPVFDFLEGSTLQAVRFTNFDYASGDKGLSLSMNGQSRGYASVALQSDKFNESKYIKSPVFSDLTLDEKGNVLFSFKATLDPQIVSYKRFNESDQVLPDNPVVPASQATSTATTTKPLTKVATTTATTTKH